jgi:uncharacterized protein (DUF1501 family)
MPLNRREFLGYSGLGLAGLAAHTLLPRRARADGAVPRARRLLILHAGGGMRSSALWNASATPQWNPFGVMPPIADVAWQLGNVLVGGGFPIALSLWGANETLQPVSAIADRITVLGAVDHDPAATAADVNHFSATLRMCTGVPDGQNGLFTILGKTASAGRALPPVIIGGSGPIGASVYGVSSGDLVPYAPLLVGGINDFRAARNLSGAADPDYVTRLEAALDQSATRGRDQALGGSVTGFAAVKRQGLAYGKVLANNALRLQTVPTATLGVLADGTTPLSNAMLCQAFGVQSGMTPVVTDAFWGPPVALAVRMLQLGSAAVAVGVGGWDFHSGEQTGLPPLAASLGRTLSALQYVLSRVVDPDDATKTLWDGTLVAVTSEFGRDNTSNTSDGGLVVGFNRGLGSDHHGAAPSRYQSLPMMGGPVAGGRLLYPTDGQVQPTAGVVATPSLLATFMAALGADPTPYFTAPVVKELFA